MRTTLIGPWYYCCVVLGCVFAAVGCGGEAGSKGSSCTVEQRDGGAAAIVCEDGSSAVVPRASGSCTIKSSSDGTKTINCSDGTSLTVPVDKDAGVKNGAVGPAGPPGAKGDPGETGSQGEPGTDGSQGNSGRSAFVAGAGLKLEIKQVEIPEDRQPVVSLQIRDANNAPLDRAGVYTQGAVSVSFVLAHLSSSDGKVGEYVPYNTASVTGAMVGSDAPVLASATQPRAENNGTWTEVDASIGTYSYRFNQVLPENYDKTKTHTLAIYASRTYSGVQYAANPIHHFRPDGQDVTERREIATTEACNACHSTLRAHGGGRRELGLCITCHVDGMNDPESGHSLDMAQMIHKIHSGSKLPSVVAGTPYKIIGYMNSVHDYSKVVFPQNIVNCSTCHRGGADSDRWKTSTRSACGSCHDLVSFTSPAPMGHTVHTGSQQTTDELCGNCHNEGMGPFVSLETDVVKVHRRLDEMPVRDLNSNAIISTPPKLSGEITSVTSTGPTDRPVINFKVMVDDQPYDILATPLNRLRFTFAGPTTDYAGYYTYTAQGSGSSGAVAAGANPGEFTWTPADGVTMDSIATLCGTDAEGSFAVGMEGRISGSATRSDGTTASPVYFIMHNPVFYFAVTDTEVVKRREAVVVERCNNCHEDLAAHGGARNDPEYCVLCHTANKDTTNIPAPSVGDTKLTTSLRMSHMIHRIHTGEHGSREYTIGSDDFSEVLFPGDRKDCTLCHVPSHYELPLPPLLPSYMTQIDSNKARVMNTEYYMQATTAACTGCHDSSDSVAHAESMTTAMGAESCTTCHGAGSAFDIDVVHARLGL